MRSSRWIARRVTRLFSRERRRGVVALAIGALLLAWLLVGSRQSRALSFEGQESRLARELSEGVAQQRVAAASELATVPREIAWPLIQLAAGDAEIEVRARAVAAAEELGLVEVLALTRPWLEAEDAELRAIAVHAEGVLGDASSVPALSRALGDARFAVRSAAAEALGALGLPACASPLGAALEDTDASVRGVAASALGRVPGDEAARLLLARSLDPALEVRVRVVSALADRSELEGVLDDRVAAVLVGALADDAEDVRVAAMLGLGRARHAQAAPFVALVLEPEGAAETRERATAIAALGRLDDEVARRALADALRDGTERQAVERAIRAQSATAPEAMEAELARVLSEARARSMPVAERRIVEAIASIDLARGSDALVAALLASIASGAVPSSETLPALGRALPRGGARAPTPHAEQAIVELLTQASTPNAPAAIAGLAQAEARGALDARAVDVLIAPEVLAGPEGLAREPRERHTVAVLTLLGRLGDARAIPTLRRHADADAPPGAAREAALDALASLDTLEREIARGLLEDLVRWLGSASPRERAAIRRIGERYGDAETVARALDALAASDAIDRGAALAILAATGARVDGPLSGRADAALVDAMASMDPVLSSSAAAAVIAHPERRAELVAAAIARLETRSRGDRLALARAARATGCESEGCRAIRREGIEALLERSAVDPARLDEIVADHGFPSAPIRSFALLEAVRRGDVGAESAPVLCALAARREPSVRANAGLALAHLGLACEGIDPTRWIASAHSVSVELAGARWCASVASDPARRCEPRRLARAVARCLDTASEPALLEACAAARDGDARRPEITRDAILDSVVVDDDGRPLRGRLVSVRFEDGATLLARTDGAGRLAMRIDRAAAREVEIPLAIEDPFATVLER